MTLPLTLATAHYDRTIALATGDVRPDGVELTYLRMPVEEVFWRMTRHGEFDAAEMSFSSYLLRRSRGDDALVAIPVFTSRYFRHNNVFVHARAGIERPEDLRGKRIGVPEYQMTAAVWIRGFLEDDYGVRPTECTWFRGGQEQTGRTEKVSIEIPDLDLRSIGEDQTLSAMLAEGELDAFIGARVPSSYDGVRVKRLFPDYRAVEADYYRRTGIFPIMHTIVIRRELLDRHPWVARSLYDAFCAAKDLLMSRVEDFAALYMTLPWMLAELEATRALMGEDYWPYGLEPSRATLEALARYSYSQGLAARLVPVEELFAPSTLDEYRI